MALDVVDLEGGGRRVGSGTRAKGNPEQVGIISLGLEPILTHIHTHKRTRSS